MDRSADSPRLFGVQARARIPSLEQRHGCRPSSFSAAHCRLPDPPPSPSGSSMETLRLAVAWKCALRTSVTKSTVPLLLDAASEMTSCTPSRGDVALNNSGLGPVLYSFATHRDLMFGHSDVPLFVSAQPVLTGIFPVSFQHRLMRTFSYTRVLLFVLHLLLTRLPNKTGSHHPPWTSSQYFPLSDRMQLLHNLSALTPPTAHLQHLGSQDDGPGLCSTLARCTMADVWPTWPTCCRRSSQISESRFSRRLDPSPVWQYVGCL